MQTIIRPLPNALRARSVALLPPRIEYRGEVTDFSFDELRRWPDPEAENLHAVDAADRLILDEAAAALLATGPGEIAVVGDNYGALSLGSLNLLSASARAGLEKSMGRIRVHQDSLAGEFAIARNAEQAGLGAEVRVMPFGPELFTGARVVLLRLPKSLDALDEVAAMIAAHAHPSVKIYAGGMIKHLAIAMNGVLGRHFESVQPGLARQKARVLTVSNPIRRPNSASSDWPMRQFHDDLNLWVCAHGGVFAGTRVDIGTRFLLSVMSGARADAASAIDFGCGTGVIASALALARPNIRVLATDRSAAAVASAQATAVANKVSDRVKVLRDDALAAQPDGSADLILLNPPFHLGATVHAGLAVRLFESAARVLTPGGELWTVFNSHLGYRRALTRIVGPTREVARNTKFTVTVSTR